MTPDKPRDQKHPNQTQLTESLQELETLLATPCIPGELENWSQAAKDQFAVVDEQLRCRIKDVHSQQFAEISEEDPELFARVEHLQEKDQQLLEQLVELRGKIDKLASRAPQVEPDEGRVWDDRKEIADAGLWFVINVRKQEVAISTWLLEAFDRDRGPVD